jgi:hypothetical protein
MESKKTGRRRLVFMLWFLIAIIYFSLARSYIRVSMNNNEFGEFLQSYINLVLSQRRSPDDLRAPVMAKARELEIPLDPVNVEIIGGGEAMELVVSYGLTIEFPLLSDAGYR